MTTGRRGSALVLVLWVIVLAGAITTTAVLSAREASAFAGTVRARVAARAAAESGVDAAAAEIESRLRGLTDVPARRRYLNDLDRALSEPELQVGDARAAVLLVDPASRLDVNNATEAQLATLFSFLADTRTATTAAGAIRHAATDSSLSGEAPRSTRRFRSLDELRDIDGIPAALLTSAAPLMTVDGDGRINRVTAPAPVLRAAGGELVDEPTRVVVISRGWLAGHPLTHEIQAVFAIAREPGGERLLLIHWRERDL